MHALLRGSIISVVAATAVAAAPRSLWHVSAGPSFLLNAEVRYGANSAADPALTPKTDRLYDDGFNRVDASGNLGDSAGGPLSSRTGYFGYLRDSQVDLRAGTLALHQAQAAGSDYVPAATPTARTGLDLAIRRSLARVDASRDWGLELGVVFNQVKQSSNGPTDANLRLLTDTYALGGVVPQRAPYTGRFTPLPGDQRIGDTPTRAIGTVAGTIGGTRSFDADVTIIRLGPWLSLTPDGAAGFPHERDRWSLHARAGLGLMSVKASFRTAEQIQVPSLGLSSTVNAAANRSRTDVCTFLGLRARRAFNERWSAIAWGDLLQGSKMTLADTARYARIDTSRCYMLGIGIEYSGKR
jgi:hypothetical protein